MDTRFQRFSERRFESSLPQNLRFWGDIKAAKWSTNGRAGVKWKGVRMLKDPFTLSLYMGLLWELWPKTIVEFGSFEGGSAAWLADISTAFQLDCRVISFDINIERISPKLTNVTYIQMDLTSISEVNLDFLEDIPRPLLILEDAHINVLTLLTLVASRTKKGDYIVVEDTVDPRKHQILQHFMAVHKDRFMVDAYYTDNFGYNASWNWNSFLRCMD